MDFFSKKLEELVVQDISSLADSCMPENVRLEYKSEPWTTDKTGTQEMLKDITAMANAYGGYLILGIKEDKTTNTFSPSPFSQLMVAKDRIQQICYSTIQPIISGLEVQTVGENAAGFMVIKIPRSLRAPHLITHDGLNQFWIRRGDQKGKMTVEELRSKFISTHNALGDAERFFSVRDGVIGKAAKSRTGRWLSIGALPAGVEFDMVDINDNELRNKIKQPVFSTRSFDLSFNSAYTVRPSFHGLIIDRTGSDRKLELFRNGYLEGMVQIPNATQMGLISGETNPEYINGYALLVVLYSFFTQLKTVSEHIGYGGEYLVKVGLHDANTAPMIGDILTAGVIYVDGRNYWPEFQLLLEPVPCSVIEPVYLTQFFGDRLWQSFNFEKAPLERMKGVLPGV